MITTPSTNKLSSLIERNESPEVSTSNLDALVSSPSAQSTGPNPSRFGRADVSVETPQTASRTGPPPAEMHPSKAQLSTKKPVPMSGPLNSHPVNGLVRSPSKIAVAVSTQRTPHKRHSVAQETIKSPTFDFSFDKPESALSSEAQKIMNSVREEAARIKTQMTDERNKQKQADEEASGLSDVAGRQIRKPKGKAGRFSDIHRAEFKKMDSIANHASTWKTKFQEAAASPLKRSPSKAGLDDTPKSLPRTKSFKSLYTGNSERLENPTPGKRMRRTNDEDTSQARPVSQHSYMEIHSVQTSPTKSPASALPSAVTTPTKASIARSASVKNLKTTMIPTLARSASTKTLNSPPRTEGSNNKRSGSWSRFGGNVKSILHRAQPKLSSDRTKIAAGTHLPLPKQMPAIDKALPLLPGTPTIKHVNFTPSTNSYHEAALGATSPSLVKAQATGSQAEVASFSPPKAESVPITYPDLTASPNITTRSKSPKATTPAPSTGPGNFTFRPDKPIAFANPTSPSANLAAARTIRPVRPSGQVSCTTGMPGAFFSPEPAISHGISNKKRKHETSSDDEGDKENTGPVAVVDEGAATPSPAKKARVGPAPMHTVVSPSKQRLTTAGRNDILKKKGGISLGRLNMLARPKERR